MKEIAGLAGTELKWEQPNSMKMEYNLYAGNGAEIVATLKFRSSFGSLATATCADGCWTFKRVGFFQTRVTIRRCDSEEEIASFRNNTWTNGGALELPGGRAYRASTNFWKTKYEFLSTEGEILIGYRKIGGFLHKSSFVDVYPAALQIPELPWMVILGWYLTIMLQQDDAAASAAVAASA
jgi:hypothetical protein